jgi:protein CWC15
LEKIKRERAEERQRQEQERLEQEMKQREEEILTGNPLLASGAGTSSSDAADFTVKRRWDDDVVFRNQSRSVPEKPEQRFINDLLRSDFHRKFMSKYIK